MSTSNPRGAIAALLARPFTFRERRAFPLCFLRRNARAVITNGTLCAVDLLDLDDKPIDDPLVVSCIVYASTRSAEQLRRDLRSGAGAFSARVSTFALRQFRTERDWRAARKLVADMLADVRASVCTYNAEPIAGARQGLPREWGLGDRCAAASMLMRVYKMRFDEWLALPLTTANMLYFAEAEHRGMIGEDTFLNRETLAGAEAILANMRFD